MTGDSGIVGEALSALASLAVRRRNRELSLTAESTLATLERTGPQRLTDPAADVLDGQRPRRLELKDRLLVVAGEGQHRHR